MEVKIISKEAIKPSSPTPSHLRNYRLSSLDFLAPKAFMPIILFYSDDDTSRVEVIEKLIWLKSSLSETLTHFYPLAGRIIANDLVECNDDGINFYDARVNSQLVEILRQPDDEKLKPLLPSDYYSAGSIKNVLFAVQVNVFDCGGMAISMCFSHNICDGASFVTFMNAWASMARGSSEFIYPTFDSASLFPTEDVSTLPPTNFLSKEKIVTKSFVFNESKIDILRDKDPTGARVGHHTRVESVSAFIWQCAMRAQSEVGPRKLSVAIHAVNVRGRMVPPLPEYSFGNLFGFAVALGVMESKCRGEGVQRCLEGRLREAIRMFDADYVKKMRGPFDHMTGDIAEAFSKGDVDLYSFTSWCSFPLYDVDFGWGKPFWVSSAWMPVKNSFVLMGRRWGDGMEVWANMAEEDMAKFERDDELLAFVSPHAFV